MPEVLERTLLISRLYSAGDTEHVHDDETKQR
jgi:hypothetical protein